MPLFMWVNYRMDAICRREAAGAGGADRGGNLGWRGIQQGVGCDRCTFIPSISEFTSCRPYILPFSLAMWQNFLPPELKISYGSLGLPCGVHGVCCLTPPLIPDGSHAVEHEVQQMFDAW